MELKVENLTKVVHDGEGEKEILHPTQFNVHSNEFVAIVGPSGSGKSTLLTLLGGLQSATTGHIMMDNTDLLSLSSGKQSHFRFEHIGFVLQSSNLVPYLTVHEQFKLIDKIRKEKENTALLNELVKQLNIEQIMQKYPADISGGERQRVAIAKALYQDTEIILADEPTASLDTVRSEEVVRLLHDETKQHHKLTIMVTHDIELTKYCDRIFEMVDGTLTEKK